jgi:hypothetical protein
MFDSAEADTLIRTRSRSLSSPEESRALPTRVDVATWYNAPDVNKVLAWFWRNLSALFKKMARDESK